MKRSEREAATLTRRLTRRGLVLGGLQLGVVGTLTWRMRSMQVEQAEEFRTLAEENRVKISLLAPSRGLIFDREGRPLATNEQSYRVVIVRDEAGDVGEVLSRLGELIPIPPEDMARTLEEMEDSAAFVPVTVVDQLAWEDVAKIAVNTPALPGVRAEVGLSRSYPLGKDTAHAIGYVGPVSDYDMTRGYLRDDTDPLLQIPKFPVGKTGVESKLEHVLRGEAGTRRDEVNADGRIMRELGRAEGLKGSDLQLTLDAKLQNFVQARLGEQSASVVVMDVETGDLRAIASAPSFDPNLFVRGISVPDYNALVEQGVDRREQRRPLASKAVQDTYPPGSTFKMITAMAAHEAGLVGPEETVWCPGHMDVAGLRFHCWKRVGHGWMNLHESLKQSCDCYYYEVAQRVGIDKIAEMARRFGLGIAHDVPMSAVREGVAPDKAWKRAQTGLETNEWRVGDTVNASIGQGYVDTSPLQLAVMCARIASGRSVEPRLIHTVDGVEQPLRGGESLGMNENLLRRIRASMYDVCNHRRGTAYSRRILGDKGRMAGKTGTSQVRRITAAERAAGVTRNEDLPWYRRDHGLFVGYAPYDNPKFAISVVVQHGGGGSSAAAPIARDVMLRALYDGPVPLDAYPSAARASAEAMMREIDLHDFDAGEGSDRA